MSTDEETPSLSLWVPLSEVSDALKINYYLIKRTVYRAHIHHETWVKYDHFPMPDDSKCWLVDVNHPTYQYHAQHWRRCARLIKAGHKTTSDDTYSDSLISKQTPEIVENWLELCHWLTELGLVVFFNAIGDDQSWQWSWLGYSGSGYPNANAAIVAAIQHQLNQNFSYATSLDTLPSEKEQSFWATLFGKRN